jgi:hypothetical protein
MLIVIEFFILKPWQIYQPKQCVVVSLKFLLNINQWAIDYIENWFMQFCKLWYREPDEMIRKIQKLSCEKLFQEIKGIK